MSDRNVVDYNGLQKYDNKIKEYISSNGANNYAPLSHTHYLGDIGFTPEQDTIPRDDVSRLKGFRNCCIPKNPTNGSLITEGNITIDTDLYDMAYVDLTGDANIKLKIGSDEGTPVSHARCLKLILKNASLHNITWEYDSAHHTHSIVWRDGDNVFSEGANKVDIVDLVTAGIDEEGRIATNTVVWYASISKTY